MSGGGVKASPRNLEKSPKKLKSQEGIEWLAGLTPLLAATDRYSDEDPEVEGADLAPGRQLAGRRSSETTRGYGVPMR
jgi:hypothetical protein